MDGYTENEGRTNEYVDVSLTTSIDLMERGGAQHGNTGNSLSMAALVIVNKAW